MAGGCPNCGGVIKERVQHAYTCSMSVEYHLNRSEDAHKATIVELSRADKKVAALYATLEEIEDIGVAPSDCSCDGAPDGKGTCNPHRIEALARTALASARGEGV